MVTKLWKHTVVIVGAVLVTSVSLVGVRAQQSKANANLLSTNWVGYLVFGSEESMDPIARGPHPTTERQIEIGLRSDGVVIWQRARK